MRGKGGVGASTGGGSYLQGREGGNLQGSYLQGIVK